MRKQSSHISRKHERRYPATHTTNTSTQPAELQQLFIIVCAYFVATLLAYVHSNYNYNNKW